ncbi:MAG: pilus assembly protein PilP [Nitrospirae bacterium]|nr:pilus assembly protein PilP [Nitrospirota bacterium]
MMNTGLTLVFSLLSAVLLVLSGCDGKPPTAPKKPEAAKPAAAVPAPAQQNPVQTAEIKVEKEVYVYEPRDRRDPFTSLVEVKAAGSPKASKGASPIESFDVEELKLIAIAWDRQQSYALVTLPDNKSFTIRKGMTLGIYGGKVREITPDSVIITEKVKDYRGQIKTKDTILKLRKEEE